MTLFRDDPLGAIGVLNQPRVVASQRPKPRLWVAVAYGMHYDTHIVGPFDTEAKAEMFCDEAHRLADVDPDYDFEGTWRVESLTQPTWTRRMLAAEARAEAVFR